MVVVPARTLVRTPVEETMVATLGSLLLHVPPGVASESRDVKPPSHSVVVPVMGAGNGLTVTKTVT